PGRRCDVAWGERVRDCAGQVREQDLVQARADAGPMAAFDRRSIQCSESEWWGGGGAGRARRRRCPSHEVAKLSARSTTEAAPSRYRVGGERCRRLAKSAGAKI